MIWFVSINGSEWMADNLATLRRKVMTKNTLSETTILCIQIYTILYNYPAVPLIKIQTKQLCVKLFL